MSMLLDAFLRAVKDAVRPVVLAWALLPLALMVLGGAVCWMWIWPWAMPYAQRSIADMAAVQWALAWTGVSVQVAVPVLAALGLLLLAGAGVLLVTMLVVTVAITPRMARLVAEHRFALLERQGKSSWWGGLWCGVWTAAVALLALIVTLPLWWVPPLMLVLPALIGGWLNYRVMTYDVLSVHANAWERQTLVQRRRWTLLLMGVMCGLGSALPAVVWASGWLFAAAFWVLIPVALCLYAWWMALSGLWFAHYCLEALYRLRSQTATSV